MSGPENDLNVGRSIATDLCVPLLQAGEKMTGPEARMRMYLGAACVLAGIMVKAIGKEDTVCALRAAIAAVEAQQ